VALKELYLEQNRLDDLIGMLHYAIDHVTPKGSFYNDLAFAYGKRGDFDSAIEMLHRAIAENPDVAEPYFNLAQMLMFRGDLAGVQANLNKALAIDGNHAQARSMLDQIQSGEGLIPEARPGSGASGRP
jgi:tetratricopeptide (TPR) repeat protein